ncbi:hypothetical protein H072_9522 [Dactylellina haptotyla CBS 200.50]|uniref:alpha-galactosidase n=1 Tax=Dactylellina haptotyla (strain CBS 200.50) TaxID=1284197 RepID=S8BCI1_DACHA|nr:hypothetical protein H072_9522 [Dactylellina haptotyla CBS 200.50]
MKKNITITTKTGVVKKGSVASESSKPLAKLKRNRPCLWILGGVILLVLIGLGVGLGVGLTRGSRSSDQDSSNDTSSSNQNQGRGTSVVSTIGASPTSRTSAGTSVSPTATYKQRPSGTAVPQWQPTAGETWQITLVRPPNNTDSSVGAFDIDLFDNSLAFFANLKLKGHKVICYFSAGSYEDWRPDAKNFTKKDYGKAMNNWAGEWWLDTNSQNVRDIMANRIELAQSKGCDAIDPDNINGYQNPTGFNLTEKDAISFLEFMATEAHQRGLAIGLKNGGALVADVVEFMDFCVQESCVAYDECGPYREFLEYNSPVFHIEYPDESNMTVAEICSPKSGAEGFSTIIKHLILDDWTEYCPS